MRTLLLFCLLICSGCAGLTTKTSQSRPADQAVLIAALRHFRSSGDAPEWRLKAGETTLFVNKRYLSDRRSISADQLAFDSRGPQWHVEDARMDMERRTGVETIVPSLDQLPATTVCNVKALMGANGDTDISTQYPEILSYLYMYPPGYTKNGKRALVVFTSWPHTNVYYLLEHRQSGWQVVRHHLTAFPD